MPDGGDIAAASITRRRLHAPLGVLCVLAALALSAPAQAAGSVYVTNYVGDTISQYGIGAGGLLAPLTPPTVGAGNGSYTVAISPDGRSVYVADFDADTVFQLDVGAGGVLAAKVPPTVVAGGNAYTVAVSPDGRSVYVGNGDVDTVSQYDVGTGGALTPKAPATVPTGNDAYGVIVSPDGQSVYVANFAGATISQYDVGADGGLTPKSPATVPAGPSPFFMAVTPDGSSVYASNFGGASVSQYDVGPGGVLVPKTPATVPTGPSPAGIGISPDGKHAYIANSGNASIGQYDIGAAGVLSPRTPATVPAGASPGALALTPDGDNLYVGNFSSNTVSQYDIGADGLLAAKTPPTVAAGTAPRGIAITPDQGPVAALATDVSPAGSPSGFDGSGSSDPDGSVARWDWDFGDGTAALDGGPVRLHTYAAAGTYTVTLTVADEMGCSTSLVFTGQTAYCNLSPAARTTRTITVPATSGRARAPTFGPNTRVSLELAATTMLASAPLRVRVVNRNGFRVTGVLGGRTTRRVRVGRRRARHLVLSAKRFTIPAGGSRTVHLGLPRSLRARLARTGRLSLTLTATVLDPAGGVRTVAKKVTPRLRRRAGRR